MRRGMSALVAAFGLISACDPETTTASGVGGMGSTSGTTGSGFVSASVGRGGAGDALLADVACDDLEYEVPDPPFVVRSQGIEYSPRCLAVPTGSIVRFEDDFGAHPLVGGTVANGEVVPDPTSPIPATTEGAAVEVTFHDAGEFGYFCDYHAQLGMGGFVRVTRPGP